MALKDREYYWAQEETPLYLDTPEIRAAEKRIARERFIKKLLLAFLICAFIAGVAIIFKLSA